MTALSSVPLDAEPSVRHSLLHLRCLGLGIPYCGSSEANPPGHIAQLFKEVIDQEFKGCYKHITFAIYGSQCLSHRRSMKLTDKISRFTVQDDHNARNKHNPEGNLLPFQRAFGYVASSGARNRRDKPVSSGASLWIPTPTLCG